MKTIITSFALVLLPMSSMAQTPPPTALQQAINTLGVANIPVPQGWTVRIAGSTSTGRGATADPNTKEIAICPAEIAATRPTIDTTSANKSGVLYIYLMHEVMHAREAEGIGTDLPGPGHPPYNTPGKICGDVQLVADVAYENCGLATVGAGVEVNIETLCNLYKDIQRNFNEGSEENGNKSAEERFEDDECSGTFPGNIPDCEACS